MGHKVTNGNGDMNNLVGGLRQNTFDTYVSIRHSVDQLLLAVCKRLTQMLDCEAKTLQQSVYAVFCKAMSGVQKSFLGVSEVVEKFLSFNVGQSKCDESATLRSLSAHFANCEQ